MAYRMNVAGFLVEPLNPERLMQSRPTFAPCGSGSVRP